MKGTIRFIAVLAVGLLTLAGCSAFTYSAGDLKGKVLTYHENALNEIMATFWGEGKSLKIGYSDNGHDTTTFSFDETGTAGSFQIDTYDYSWADAAAYDGGNGAYSTKSWFQYGGRKGAFTYAPDTGAISITITSGYAPKAGAVPLDGNYLFAAADYEWQDLFVVVNAESASQYTDYTESFTATLKLTADGVYIIYAQDSGNADSWVTSASRSESGTTGGVTVSGGTTMTKSYTITDGSLVLYTKVVYTDMGTPTSKRTEELTYKYSVTNAYLVGQDDSSSATFADKWKKGNAVTFQAQETEYDYTSYTRDTAPAAPTVDPITGEGETNIDADNFYIVTMGAGSPATFNLTNEGTYIFDTSSAGTASRHLQK
jgi:hypothetical protein